MSKILVTGANGFVGHSLCGQLLHHHYHVVATGKGGNRLPFHQPNFSYQDVDFTNTEIVKQVCIAEKPSIILHAGAMSSADACEQDKKEAYRVNVQGTINLLQAAEKVEAHFIFLSTDFVFDGEKGLYKEEDERRPVNYYGQTKLMAEDEVMQYKHAWSIIRTVLVYGKSLKGRGNLVTSVAKSLQEGKALKIFDDQERTPSYVEDLSKGIISLVQKKAQGIYHICGEDIRTPYEIAMETARHLGFDGSQITPVTAADLPQTAIRPLKTGLRICKTKKELGFRPLSFAEGLRLTLG